MRREVLPNNVLKLRAHAQAMERLHLRSSQFSLQDKQDQYSAILGGCRQSSTSPVPLSRA